MQTLGILRKDEIQIVISRIQWWFRGGIALCALIDCWINRFQMNPDGISYLDMGDLYWKGNWHAAFNLLWSPLYSWLTGLMLLLAKPVLRWEYPLVHLLTFAILVATLFCFEFFWRELLASQVNVVWVGPWRPYAWILGYLLFAYIHLGVHRLLLVTPDLLVDALVYLTFGMMLRFLAGRMGAPSAFLLGVLLGVGYLAKAAMMPFAVVFLLTMLAAACWQKRRKMLSAVALAGFLLASLPYVTALSLNAHRFTWGDAAKLNQGLCVNHVRPPSHNWQGDQPGHRDAQHPTRKIFSWPEAYEFSAPIAGTYPVWYDPVYWSAGLDSKLHPEREMQVIVSNSLLIAEHVLLESGFFIMVALMFALGGRIKDSWNHLLAFWPIYIPAIAVFLMYALVHWEARYTTGMMLVLWAVGIAAANVAGDKRMARVFWIASLLLSALTVGRFATVLSEDHRNFRRSEQTLRVAEELQAAGIGSRTPIAVIGDGNTASYWARLGGWKIIAEVPQSMGTGDSASAFWESSPQTESAVLNALKNTGAKEAVADVIPTTLPPEWLPLGNTGRAIHFFQDRSQ